MTAAENLLTRAGVTLDTLTTAASDGDKRRAQRLKSAWKSRGIPRHVIALLQLMAEPRGGGESGEDVLARLYR